MNQLQEIFTAWGIAFNPNDEQAEKAAKRIEVCNSCDKKVTNLGVHRCSVCGCALKGKVYSPIDGACPEGKWDEIDAEYTKSQQVEITKEDTIFVQIASYRDPELNNTLKDLFINADYPDNLRVCIAHQYGEDDWDNLDSFKDDKRVKILSIPHEESKGTCWARNKIQQEYNNEKYTLQLDSHHRFINGWDKELINMLVKLQKKGYKKPLLSSYIPSYFPEKDPQGRTQEVWQLDFNRFTPQGYIYTFPATIPDWKNLKEPIIARFYSAHFAFTLGQFCKEVSHDPNMYFHGEEPSISARAFTWGYDIFHPHKIIAWHFYSRNGFKKHWDDHQNWGEIDSKSFLRYRQLHEMDDIVRTEELNKSFKDYDFGTVRTLKDYEHFAGVRFKDRKVTQHTKDKKPPSFNLIGKEEEYEKDLVEYFRHCIDIHESHFKENDYDFWVVAFEMNDGSVIDRSDANEEELNKLLRAARDGDGWVRIWREFDGKYPDKYVVWPHSKSKDYIERLEVSLK